MKSDPVRPKRRTSKEPNKKGILDKIRVQDVALVLLCIIAVYLLRSKEQYEINPSWRLENNITSYRNMQYPTRDEQLPLPLVTDLDADGNNEVISVTQSLLKIASFPEPETTKKQLPQLIVENEITFPDFDSEDGLDPVPVSMATGYLSVVKENQTQIIIVLFNNWHVMCYSHSLSLLWQRPLGDVLPWKQQHPVQTASILIMPHSVMKGNSGMVVIGGSTVHEAHHSHSMEREEESTIEHRRTRGAVSAKSGTPVNPDPRQDSHFSTVALGGTNGTVLWHHLPGDFETKEDQDPGERLHWKLQLLSQRSHIGEVHWTKYRHQVTQLLPHGWQAPSDTKIRLTNIKSTDRHHEPNKRNQDDGTIASLLGLSRSRSPDHGHIPNPNAIVVYHQRGLEILSLKTGQPLTHINMQTKSATYGDVNGDGVLDKVEAVVQEGCSAIAQAQEGTAKRLYEVPFCELPSLWTRITLPYTFRVQEVSEDTHVAVPPLLVHSSGSRGGMVGRLMSDIVHGKPRGLDALFLTSKGGLTSVGPTGQINWQVWLEVGWVDVVAQLFGAEDGSNPSELFEKAFLPSLMVFNTKGVGKANVLLVSGWNNIALIDLHDGHTLAMHSTPCQPTAKPVLVDFNQDGYLDVVMFCPRGYVGFTLTPVTKLWYTALTSVGVTLCMLLLHWFCLVSPTESEDDASSDG